jgi:acetyl-CoA acetyltransferase
MRPVSIIGIAATAPVQGLTDDVALLVSRVISAALADAGVERGEIDFTCSGSCDYIQGRPFSFVQALDGVGAWPPIQESHVEMDGAWALQEAWVHLQTGHADLALAFAWGHGTRGDPEAIFVQSHDPYTLAPLGIGPSALTALQTRILIARGHCTERDLADIVARNLATVSDGTPTAEQLLDRPHTLPPLRQHDCPRWTDGAAAVVLAAGDALSKGALSKQAHRHAWIRHLDHRIDCHQPGHRDLTTAHSASLAALGSPSVDSAELHTAWTPQEIVLRRALGLGDTVVINRSGGPGVACTPMVSGLMTFVHGVTQLRSGAADRVMTHATSGPCLQQNLIAVLEGA